MKRFAVSLTILVLAFSTLALAQDGHPLTIEDLLKVRRVADPQVSPKGDLVAYTITDINMDANRGISQIYLIPIKGGQPRQLTKEQQPSASPRWAPDGSKLAFVRDDQIWT